MFGFLLRRDQTPSEYVIDYASMSPGSRGLSLGPFLFGAIADCAMFGAICSLLMYGAISFMRYESRWVRGLVIYLSILSAVDTAYVASWIFAGLVRSYGSFNVSPEWFSWYYLVGALFRIPVIAFFGERAWQLIGRNYPFAVCLCVCSVGCLIGGLGSKVTASLYIQGINVRTNVENQYNFIFLYLCSEMVADVAITATMLFKLLHSQTGWQTTDKKITRVSRIIAETQLPPTVFAAVLLAFVALNATVYPNNITAFFLCAHKVYVLCVLSVLTIRHNMREEDDLVTGSRSGAGGFSSKVQSTRPRIAPQIYVHTEIETHGAGADMPRRPGHGVPAPSAAPSNRSVNFEDDVKPFADRNKAQDDMRMFLDDGPDGGTRGWKPLDPLYE